MWTYWDESGDFQNQDFICMCGILFDDDQRGNAFESKWRKILSRLQLPAIHANQLFADLKFDQGEHERALDECAVAITECLWAFGVGMDAAHWRVYARRISRRNRQYPTPTVSVLTVCCAALMTP